MRPTQVQQIINFLEQNSGKKFTARQIADKITTIYAHNYRAKRANFATEDEFMEQVRSEVAARKDNLIKACPNLVMQDHPRPRLYWYETTDNKAVDIAEIEAGQETDIAQNAKFTEHELYPQLMQFLSDEMGLYCLRIDEKRSKNNRGTKGNQWLHPDIVAMQTLDKDWNDDIRNCVKIGNGQNVLLWSFEVKTELNGSNVRESFFQAVSNASWANEGYLVATAIIGEHTEEELRILSALHGIGVIILNLNELSDSEILLPARRKAQIDWQSVNRIVAQNKDFETFIEYVAIYYQSGKVIKSNWNK